MFLWELSLQDGRRDQAREQCRSVLQGTTFSFWPQDTHDHYCRSQLCRGQLVSTQQLTAATLQAGRRLASAVSTYWGHVSKSLSLISSVLEHVTLVLLRTVPCILGLDRDQRSINSRFHILYLRFASRDASGVFQWVQRSLSMLDKLMFIRCSGSCMHQRGMQSYDSGCSHHHCELKCVQSSAIPV